MKYLICFLALAFPLTLFSQSIDQVSWSRLASPKGDVALSLPREFLVDKDSTSIEVVYRKDKVYFAFEAKPGGDPKTRLADSRRWTKREDDVEYSQFTLGNFAGDIRIRKKKRYSISFIFASNKGFYRIVALADNAANPILEKFLKSIRLEDRPLIKQANPAVFSEVPIHIDGLQASQEVKKALTQPNAENFKVIHDADPTVTSVDDDDYSIPPWILRRPQARFTETPNDTRNGSAVIRLRVHFGADGQIRGIVVLSGSQLLLINSAVVAAKQIKFIPAEKDGKRVDSYVTVEYTFGV